MSNRLIRFELGSGAGVVVGGSYGMCVIGENFPTSSSTDMFGVATTPNGDVFISDSARHAIYKVTRAGQGKVAGSSPGNITLWAGWPGSDGFVNGVGTAARFSGPLGIACDKSGNLYVADSRNGRLRKIDARANVTTVAGGFGTPVDVATTPNGDVIVVDNANNKIWKVEPHGRKLVVAGDAGGASGDVSGTVAGVQIKGNAAKFSSPYGVCVDRSGNIFVADSGNNKIKKIDSSGWVTWFSGSGVSGNVNGEPFTARFTNLVFLAVNNSDELFVVDRVASVNRIKMIDPKGKVSTVGYASGATPLGSDADGALGVDVDNTGTLYVVTSEGKANPESSSSESSESSDSSISSSSDSSISSISSSDSSISSSSSSDSSNSSSSDSSISSSSDSSTSMYSSLTA